MKRDTKKAFYWIVGILKRHKVPFRISGGMAARIYGSKRPLADIDIEIPEACFEKILPELKKYLIFGPRRNKDNLMNVYGLSMKYSGQIIDLSGADTERLYDIRKKKWIKSRINLKKVKRVRIFGLSVPVIEKKDLILYKNKLRRAVDLEDIKSIS